MKLKETHKYDDIIHLSRPVSGRRVPMSNYDRAAQFSPFAALTGFEAAIEETGRLTDTRAELDEGGRELLDRQMREILDVLDTCPRVAITWFRYDERKAGGSYVETRGCIKKIDRYHGQILLTDGRAVPLEAVHAIAVIK